MVRACPRSCRVRGMSGNLALRRQQFWLGPARAGIPVTLWADAAVVHLLIDGVRLKTVPSGSPQPTWVSCSPRAAGRLGRRRCRSRP